MGSFQEPEEDEDLAAEVLKHRAPSAAHNSPEHAVEEGGEGGAHGMWAHHASAAYAGARFVVPAASPALPQDLQSLEPAKPEVDEDMFHPPLQ